MFGVILLKKWTIYIAIIIFSSNLFILLMRDIMCDLIKRISVVSLCS